MSNVVFHKSFKVAIPLRSGRGCNSKSAEFLYLDDPCDFLVFFFRERFANGSILSTKVAEDMLSDLYATVTILHLSLTRLLEVSFRLHTTH
jgi:hypothetical protein